MMSRAAVAVAVMIALTGASPLTADDLTGTDAFLCSATQAVVCPADLDCMNTALEDLNMPQFVEVNLRDRKLSTTKASGLNRSTPIKNLERQDGMIYLQGVEGGRAFSFVIEEATGQVSIAVARKGMNVGVFGACTPLPWG